MKEEMSEIVQHTQVKFSIGKIKVSEWMRLAIGDIQKKRGFLKLEVALPYLNAIFECSTFMETLWLKTFNFAFLLLICTSYLPK